MALFVNWIHFGSHLLGNKSPFSFFFIDQAREGISRAKNDVRLTHQIQAREMVMKMHRHGNAQMTGRILRPGTQPWPQDNYWRNWYKVISFIHQSADDHFNEIHSKYSNDYCSICKWIENSSKVFWLILVIITIIIYYYYILLLLYIIILLLLYYYYYYF